MKSNMVPPSAALRIDKISSCGRANAGGRKGGFGGIPHIPTLVLILNGVRRGDACIVFLSSGRKFYIEVLYG